MALNLYVKVFSFTASKWVDAKVVAFPEQDMVRVEYQVAGSTLGKTLNFRSAHIVFEELAEMDPELFWGLCEPEQLTMCRDCDGTFVRRHLKQGRCPSCDFQFIRTTYKDFPSSYERQKYSRDSEGYKEFVKAGLKYASKCDAKVVDVDKKMLAGRKADRGFTVAIGKSTAEEVDVADLRRGKRAQTLRAANMRRGDHILNEDSIVALHKRFEFDLKARYRRGSVTVAITIIENDDLKKTWEEKTLVHSHGIMTEGQVHDDERMRVFFNMEDLPGPIPPIISCHKGAKSFLEPMPNQDNFSITYFKTGHNLACVFDGHGPFGHIVSTRTVQTVPYYFVNSPKFPDDIPGALIEAFETSHQELVAHSLQNSWDVQASGSTAVACVWREDTVWTANAGDSRCVIGTETSQKIVFETEDHKPNADKEKARIEASGGEVRTQTYPDGWVNHRMFVKGEDYPGLSMSRALGDQSGKEHGLIATPEVTEVKVDLKELPFILLASDGVWDFLDSEFVIKTVAKKIKSDGPARTVQKLQREAKKRWRQEEGDYCDDITSVLIQLGTR